LGGGCISRRLLPKIELLFWDETRFIKMEGSYLFLVIWSSFCSLSGGHASPISFLRFWANLVSLHFKFAMGRILGIDYGQKRCGISATDPLQIIVSAVDTVDTSKLKDYLKNYFDKNQVDKVVLGLPLHKDGNVTAIKPQIDELESWIKNQFPSIETDHQEESFTSVQAKEIIFQSGVPQKKRRDKALVDKVSAVLILQKYLKHI